MGDNIWDDDDDPIWVKDDGTEVSLSQMSKAHISNCINCIRAGKIRRIGCSGYTTEAWIKVFETELAGRNLLTVWPM